MQIFKQVIKGFGIWFQILLKELAINSVSVILVVLLYLVLWKSPQAIDLLLVLNQNSAKSYLDIFTLEVPLYFSLLTALAFFIWNAPKYLYRENYKQITRKNFISFVPTNHYKTIQYNAQYIYNCKYHIRKVLPRVLGCLVMFISSFAILNAIEEFGLQNIIEKYLNPNNTLIIITLFLLLLLEYNTYNFIVKLVKTIPKLNYVVFLIIFLFIFIIFILGIVNNQSGKDLKYLFVSHTLLALMFFVTAFNTKRLLTNKVKPYFYGGMMLSVIIIFLVYVAFNIFPNVSRLINPLSVVLICLIALYSISFFLVFLGKKSNMPIFTLAFIVGLAFVEINSNRENYKHYILQEDIQSSYNRVNLKAYIRSWILHRKDKILKAKNKGYPVLFVASEGGGSRAGLWSFLIHSYLTETSDNKYYEDYLFSLTGASGGSVGNSLFFATAQYAKNNDISVRYTCDDGVFNYKASKFFSENYLSSSVVALFGRDFINSIIGFLDYQNRGKLLENEWSKAHKTAFNLPKSYLDQDIFLPYLENKDSLRFVPPLLILNSSHAQSGQYSVISPADFKNEKRFKGYKDFIYDLNNSLKSDKKENFQKPDINRSIRLEEAMRINAAFPYLTPVGEIKGLGSFGDAGYYDNIGGTVNLSLIDVFKEVLEEDTLLKDYKDKLDLRTVLINSDVEKEKDYKDISQLVAPFQILLNVRSGHTKAHAKQLEDNVITLRRYDVSVSTASKKSLQEAIRQTFSDKSKNTIEPILPVGRYLSETAIKSMEKYLKDSISSKLTKLIELKQNYVIVTE